MTRLCIDCKWFVKRGLWIDTVTARGRCTNQNTQNDFDYLVAGNLGECVRCTSARGKYGQCTPEGKFWEAKS